MWLGFKKTYCDRYVSVSKSLSNVEINVSEVSIVV